MFLIILLSGTCCGCWQTEKTKELNQMVEKTKSEFKASEIKAAVIPLFKKYKLDSDIPNSEIPKGIGSLPFFTEGVTNVKVLWAGSCSNTLMFITGGGYGYWGIVVSLSDEDQRVKENFGSKVIPWEAGIYFYRD
jgi:hypothetical protein